jgi:hypothetical protein
MSAPPRMPSVKHYNAGYGPKRTGAQLTTPAERMAYAKEWDEYREKYRIWKQRQEKQTRQRQEKQTRQRQEKQTRQRQEPSLSQRIERLMKTHKKLEADLREIFIELDKRVI